MLIILSPAKSLDYKTKLDLSKNSRPIFEDEALKLISEIKKLKVSDLQKLMSISKKLAELNFTRFQNFSNAESRQALLAFDGDVYSKIDKKSFVKDDFDYCQKHIRILSGLYGWLSPLDLIKPHRLEMGTDLKSLNFSFKNLYEFWGKKITEEINKSKAESLINLASNEYFSVINLKEVKKKIVNIIFKEKKNGELKIIGISSKKARGLMTNFAIKNKIQNEEILKSFCEENYVFAKEISDAKNWVFVR